MKSGKRRVVLKSIVGGGGALLAEKSLPKKWTKPVVDTVLLPAHAVTSSVAGASSIVDCPTFVETTNWYEMEPQTQLSALGQIQFQITLENSHPTFDMELDGDFQLWTVPSVIERPTLPVVINSVPIGTFAPGETFTYDLTVDVSGLPDTEVAMAFRGNDINLFGNIRPDVAAIISTDSTCG